MALPLSERISQISSSPTMAVTATVDRLRRSGIEVIDFGAGEPDFPTPEAVKNAGHDAITHNFTRYTPVTGIADLKRAIADRYKADYGIEYAESEVIVTAGGKQALYNTMLALFGPGDDVVTHAPFWPTIPEQIKLAGARPVLARTYGDEGFRIQAGPMIDAITPSTRGIVVNSPCNPTGALMPEAEMALLGEECVRRGLWVVLDLCYERLIYEPVPHNLPAALTATCRDQAVLCGSSSKAYSMTGWRCGWALGPVSVTAAAGALQSHATSNVNSMAQKAAIVALSGSQAPFKAMLDEYRERRDAVHGWLTANPRLHCLKPGGAFYLFIDVGDVLSPNGLRTSADFAKALLEEERVAVTPGEAFDAPGFVRISYATSMELLREGSNRMLAFVDRHA